MIRNSLKIGLGLLVSLAISNPANAWNDPSKSSKSGTTKPGVNSVQNKAANCSPASSLVKMEWNNVSALIETGGSMWQDRSQGNAAYEVPIGSGNTSIYSGALWMGGEDVNGQLKLAAVIFRSSGNDFWTGPLTVTPGSGNGSSVRDFGPAEIEPDVCDDYDQFFATKRSDISTFRGWYRCGIDPDCDQSAEYPAYSVPQSITEWPAHGDIGRFQDQYLAPFYDTDGDGFYNPGNGDYPKYDLDSEFDCTDPTNRAARAIFGDVNYWWVFNDKGNIHTESNGDPIGMEVRAQAFAFATNDEVNNMTFYNYEMINRSTQTLTNTYFGQFVDADLGCSEDDYVGCDVSRGLGFAYNADATDNDGCNGAIPYDGIPPAIGVDFFEGPYQDVDGMDNAIGIGPNEAVKGNGIGYGDSIVDNERFGMRKFLYFDRTTGGSYGTDPNFAGDYYDYMKGIWLDGSRFVYGGNGHVSSGGTVECDFTFPGNSDLLNWGTNGLSQAPWDEVTAGNAKGDRRFLQSAGPFTLEPGALNNITVGVVWARASNGDNFSSVDVLKIADQKAQALFENCFRIIDGPDAPDLTVQELDKEVILYISNSPNGNNQFEDYEVRDPFIIVPPGEDWDTKYKFQGYQVFQLKNDEVSAPDLGDPDLARIVAQFDYKDGIGQLINYNFNEAIGVAEPVEEVQANGSDNGVQHAIKLSTDLFATGDSRLINHKKYYYMARAYAHNNYKNYDPTDSDALDGQKTPFLPGRKNAQGTTLRAVTAIPHITDPENGGSIINADFGASPIITRIEGQGNATFNIDIDKATENDIVTNYTKDKLTYKPGAGPVKVRVIDPLNVVAGDYQLRFLEDSGATINHVDSAMWELVNLSTFDTIISLTTIAQNNEQLIPEWGISVQVEQYNYLEHQVAIAGTDPQQYNNYYTAELIEATMEYENGGSDGWLTGVEDIDGPFAKNWIRSGTVSVSDGTAGVDFCDDIPRWNDATNLDDEEVFEGLLGGIIAPFRLASYNNCHDNITPTTVAALFTYSGFKDLASLGSFDLVMTSDKSKWTRCPVIEMQFEPVLAIGGAAFGTPRNSPSLDKDGNEDGTGTGMSWFPGYVINVSTGERLNMAFGEDSWLGGDNGRDMLWNPSSREESTFGDNIWGGKHTIYIFRNSTSDNDLSKTNVPVYDEGVYMEDNFVNGSTSDVRRVWRGCSWVMQPMLEREAVTGTTADPYAFITEDVKVRVRVSKPYQNYETSTGGAENAGYGLYTFSTKDIATTTNYNDTAVSALDIINVVPNPYYAYSGYEENRLDNRIKITNLPDVCDIKIFNTAGTLIRTFSKDSKITSVDWDLKNGAGIPIASGVYIIHVNVDGVGEKIVKWFGAMRPPDLENF